jgi:hypothetical protein
MRGSQVTCKFIEGIMPNEDTWGDIDHTVIRVEFLDGGASLRRVTFSENFLKVTEEQLVNSFGHIFFSLLKWSLFAADSGLLGLPVDDEVHFVNFLQRNFAAVRTDRDTAFPHHSPIVHQVVPPGIDC